MSRSLNRIRSLVSEIEQIQRQGQKAQARIQSEAMVLPFEPAKPKAVEPESPAIAEAPAPPGRVSLQWSGSVVLDLRFPHSNETLQLRQVGDLIEIRFSDGKAVHIPFKAVA
ncbi:MAG: hypothetical protein KGP28_09615 [Bdellovibrionales bacterium]|nr:hypothetical protein [Bdellovibrionales bacterium]